MMKNLSFFLFSVFLASLSIFLIHRTFMDVDENIFDTDTVFSTKTDTVFKTDTVILTNLVPKYIVKTRTDTLFKENGEKVELVEENKIYQDTIISDKDTAEISIFTSGINTRVNSVMLNLKKSEIIKTNTIETNNYIKQSKKFKDRIHFSPNLSVGYGMINKKPDVYVGFGVSFEL